MEQRACRYGRRKKREGEREMVGGYGEQKVGKEPNIEFESYVWCYIPEDGEIAD